MTLRKLLKNAKKCWRKEFLVIISFAGTAKSITIAILSKSEKERSLEARAFSQYDIQSRSYTYTEYCVSGLPKKVKSSCVIKLFIPTYQYGYY